MTYPFLDHPHDTNGQHLHRLVTRHEPPEYVKNASAEQLDTDGLPASAFADPVDRRLPIHTKEATWTSWLYYLDQLESASQVGRGNGVAGNQPPHRLETTSLLLQKAAVFHGIARDCADLAATCLEKKAAEEKDDDYALCWDTPEGRERRWPLRTAEEVKRAAAYLRQHRADFGYRDRHDFAAQLLRKTACLGVNLAQQDEDLLRRCCAQALSPPTGFARLLREKAAQTGDLAVGHLLKQAADACGRAPAGDLSDLLAALDPLYQEQGWGFPEDTLHAWTPKAA